MMHSSIFDIEALERKDYSNEGNVAFLNQPSMIRNNDSQGDLEVFDFVPEEPSRPWSLDDEAESRADAAIGKWGENAMDGLDDSYSGDEKGRAVAVSAVAGPLILVGLIAAQELIK